MLIGANFSRKENYHFLSKKIALNEIHFVELMVDNVINFNCDELGDLFRGIPVAFHIMNSNFIGDSIENLAHKASKISKLIASLNPIYVSDHLGMLSYQNTQFPIFLEACYKADSRLIVERIKAWTDLLNTELYLENYPSYHDGGLHQIEFFDRLIENAECKLLFDFSNAYIAYKNCGVKINDWTGLIKKSTRFHISGFRQISGASSLYIDTHDSVIDENVIDFLGNSSILNNKRNSIVIEHDSEDGHAVWSDNIKNVKEIYYGDAL